VHPEQPGKAERAAVAVPIAVAVGPEDPAAAENRPHAETAALRPKPARASEPVRGDTSLPQPTAPAVAAAPADPTAAPRLAPGAPGPMQMPSPTDIGAALDRLVAAREALVPAAAALAIEHAEFGEVSIRFEQTSDGRLSAEVASADPALREVLNAAVAAERGVSTAAEGDAGRPAGQRSQSASGDAASSERGQSGDDRNPNQRRAQGRDQPARAPGTPHPGVFA
jgi:hypothetical protein